jgi:leucine dehydrogenase
MSAFDLLRALGHEEVVLAYDRAAGLRAIIAIHDTTFGPAVGGTRMRPYPDLDAAMVDALRLSRAMTYKAVMCGMKRGGGKAVIVGDPARDKTPVLLEAYARAVDRLGGRFHTGGDMGIDGRDVAVFRRFTNYASHTVHGSRLDTSALAALGVFESIRAAASLLDRPLRGLRVAVQGVGELGSHLAHRLASEGVRVVVADPVAERVEAARRDAGVEAVEPEAIYDVECDVFSPNAVTGVLNDQTIPRLRCRAVVGGANEQLGEPRDGDALHERGILYAPDYVVNAGGLLSLLWEVGETDEAGVIDQTRAIGPRVLQILTRSRQEGVASHRLADRSVEERLAAARAARPSE